MRLIGICKDQGKEEDLLKIGYELPKKEMQLAGWSWPRLKAAAKIEFAGLMLHMPRFPLTSFRVESTRENFPYFFGVPIRSKPDGISDMLDVFYTKSTNTLSKLDLFQEKLGNI